MGLRLELQMTFEEFVDNVYFQPPDNTKIEYPCIVYQRDASDAKFADNKLHTRTKRYQVTVIDRDPDSELSDIVEELPLCTFNRFFATENLNHYVFTLFF